MKSKKTGSSAMNYREMRPPVQWPADWSKGLIKIALLATPLSIVACTAIPVDRYQALVSSSQSIQNDSAKIFAEIERQQRDYAIFTAPDSALDKDSFKPVVIVPNLPPASYDITPSLDSREAALATLVDYAKALDALAEKDYANGVDSAAQNLAASLKALPAGAEASTAVKALSSVVDLLGHAATDRLKRNYLEEAMKRGQPGVDALAALFRKDEKPIETFVDHMRDTYITHAERGRPPYGTWERYKFDQEVASQLEAYEAVKGSLRSMDMTIAKLPAAHQELMDGLQHGGSKTEEMKSLIQSLKATQAFYKNL